MPLAFEDLTADQINYFWNGVGSDHFLFNPPDLIFKEASKKHDFLFWMGGSEDERKAADSEFYYTCWRATLKNHLQILRPFYFSASWLYYHCLKLFSKTAWEYCTEEEKPKTWEDLKARIDRRRLEIELETQSKWYNKILKFFNLN